MHGPDIARRTPSQRLRAMRQAQIAQWRGSAPAGGATAQDCLRMGQDPSRRLEPLRRLPRARYGLRPQA